MDSFDEQILGDDQPVLEDGALLVQAREETPALELREEPELTEG
jgi:hypothetical protein